MELKEYIMILRKNIGFFLTILAIFVSGGVIFALVQPQSYHAALTLNVTRDGLQKTDNYRYDSLYRLQADERFADTVVRWLESPRVSADILNDAKIDTNTLAENKLAKYFKARRLSSQIVQVDFAAARADLAGNISDSVKKIINAESEKLNAVQKEDAWFIIIGGEPVVRPGKLQSGVVILVSLLAGIFIGLWAVLIKNYFTQ